MNITYLEQDIPDIEDRQKCGELLPCQAEVLLEALQPDRSAKDLAEVDHVGSPGCSSIVSVNVVQLSSVSSAPRPDCTEYTDDVDQDLNESAYFPRAVRRQ